MYLMPRARGKTGARRTFSARAAYALLYMGEEFIKRRRRFYGKLSLRLHGVHVSGSGVLVERTVRLERGAYISGPAYILGVSTVSAGARILPFSYVEDSFIGEYAEVRASTVNSSCIGRHSTVGPYAYLRQGADVGEDCRIGDFVEVKNSIIGAQTKAAHHAYIGDADIGRRVNIGCGTVFCNYDGNKKVGSKVGDGCFIGGNCNIVAPVNIGAGAYVAAGTTVTRDLEGGDFCIGRQREKVHPHGAEGRYEYGKILRD